METTGIVNDIVNEIVTCGRVFSLSLFNWKTSPIPQAKARSALQIAQHDDGAINENALLLGRKFAPK